MSSDRSIRLALCQINATVGDVSANAERLVKALRRARAHGAQLAVSPELALSGYPPEDLLSKPHFVAACGEALRYVAAQSPPELVALVGCPESDGALFNSLAVIAGGEVHGSYRKHLLPNYGVFDERRYFEPGRDAVLIDIGGIRVGLTICEDIWFSGPPASTETLAGASLIVNASASPFHRAKGPAREAMVAGRARETGAAYALCNMVGGQDELVFDGHSVIVDHAGVTLGRARQFEEDLLVCDVELPPGREPDRNAPPGASLARRIGNFEVASRKGKCEPRLEAMLEDAAEVYSALVVGLHDYVKKNRFEHVVLGLSGGIDSALVATIASDALGADAVTAVTMPSPFSSSGTYEDALELARRLGCKLFEVPIGTAMDAYHSALAPALGDDWGGLAYENIQARIRGNLVMALSNHNGWLPISTGNKSETAVGYTTLYGDMAGGFALIKDVPKTLVYELARHRNGCRPDPVIPQSIIDRAPSAELRPDQRDTDSLPAYELLDEILERYVELDDSPDQIVAEVGEPKSVDRVVAMVDRAEYKRRQAPPGVKITPRAFGRDRRLPITNRFGA